MEFNQVLRILDDVPDYEAFLTVDELKASTRQLANTYPEIAEVIPIGPTRMNRLAV
jgi:hypothetical protein